MIKHRIIVKLGTSTLTAGTTKISLPHLVALVRQVAQLHREGHQILLVSSGAIASGKEELNFPELPKFIPSKQMLSAVGQPRLMRIYAQLFSIYGETVAQILLTRADLSDRRRYLNARNTLEALLGQQVIPIVNENDTVATEEIRFGDNDNLSALVANLVEADLLILLTDQPGLLTSDPRVNANAQLVTQVITPEIPDELWHAAGGTRSGLGTGGMVTKLSAADLARRSGTQVIIARGSDPDIIIRIASGESVGTLFTPVMTTLESRKRYLLAGMKSSGELQIDEGAINALLHGGSLLPVGVKIVHGEFGRGDTVRVTGPSGKETALGLVNYAAKDLSLICGRQSSEIEPTLGYSFGDEVIHRNNLLML
jgi:glutamate 5-kinase